MSLIGTSVKLLACVAVVGGTAGYPYLHSSKDLFPAEKEKVNWVLGKSSTGSAGLFLEDMDKIDKLFTEKKKSELTVEEVGMKFGDRSLSSRDILKSPCEDGKYYLLKHVDNSGQYELKEGLKVSTLRCGDGRLKDVEHVELKWGKPQRRDRPLTNIRLSDCRFTQVRGSNIRIICNKNEVFSRLQFTFTAPENGSK